MSWQDLGKTFGRQVIVLCIFIALGIFRPNTWLACAALRVYAVSLHLGKKNIKTLHLAQPSSIDIALFMKIITKPHKIETLITE